MLMQAHSPHMSGMLASSWLWALRASLVVGWSHGPSVAACQSLKVVSNLVTAANSPHALYICVQLWTAPPVGAVTRGEWGQQHHPLVGVNDVHVGQLRLHRRLAVCSRANPAHPLILLATAALFIRLGALHDAIARAKPRRAAILNRKRWTAYHGSAATSAETYQQEAAAGLCVPSMLRVAQKAE